MGRVRGPFAALEPDLRPIRLGALQFSGRLTGEASPVIAWIWQDVPGLRIQADAGHAFSKVDEVTLLWAHRRSGPEFEGAEGVGAELRRALPEQIPVVLQSPMRLVDAMPAEPIQFFNRYTKIVETEKVFGEKWLRLAYENPAGRLFVWLLGRRKLFSWWYGRKMSKPLSALQIIPFIAKYNVDVDEFAKSPFDYKTFNEFFYRALKPGMRPVAAGERVAVFPADGRHLVLPDVEATPGFYVKGKAFTLNELFHDPSRAEESELLAAKFAGGAMVISRLCPVDYHRFHFPVDGAISEPRLINGYLYSVNPIALRQNLGFLVENKRVLTLIESPAFGTVAMFEIGATNVGTIRQTFVPGRPAVKGEEKGLFAFGGSCVITIFQRDHMRFDADLLVPCANHMEVYAKVGDRLGIAR